MSKLKNFITVILLFSSKKMDNAKQRQTVIMLQRYFQVQYSKLLLAFLNLNRMMVKIGH